METMEYPTEVAREARQEPTPERWADLWRDYGELKAQVDILNKELNSKIDKELQARWIKAFHEDSESAVPMPVTNFNDISGNILARVEAQRKNSKGAARTSAEVYAKCLRDLETMQKYLGLVNAYPEFRQGEVNNNGTFPDLIAKFAGHPEELQQAGYGSYKDAYVYEAAKRLELQLGQAATSVAA